MFKFIILYTLSPATTLQRGYATRRLRPYLEARAPAGVQGLRWRGYNLNADIIAPSRAKVLE